MNRIDKKFKLLKKSGKKALIIYITGGDPSIKVTIELLHKLVDAGADIIEIGVPFSDPMGDGIANQKAAARALKKNTSLKDIFSCVTTFRKKNNETPIVLFSYLNPVYHFGYNKFAEKCRISGVDGCLFVDMPYDEEIILQDHLYKKNIHVIYLVAPTTEKTRLNKICKKTKGFLYAVSSLGVTGERNNFDKGFNQYINTVKKACRFPVCVGFGISTPQMAKKAVKHSDGVIIGSAVVNRIEKYLKDKDTMI
ncbi:MAG: tryptophan synthase subunit alpha [Candidatus Aureabacteria bacterium]|nr:tryptophan synthase subunit alpha [Candidatus Auribacterota bacterium]